MNIWMILKIIAALATAATGLLAFFKPTATYGFIGLNANGVRGVSEIRAIFGGLFIGLGIAPLFLGELPIKCSVLVTWRLPRRGRFRSCSINPMPSQTSSAWSTEIVLGVLLVI